MSPLIQVPAALSLLHQKSFLIFSFERGRENSCVGFENGLLMVTGDTQKLCCDSEVFCGQLTPLSGAAKQAGCSRRKENPLERVVGVSSGQIGGTFAKKPFQASLHDLSELLLVFSSFLPCERNRFGRYWA